MKNAVTGNMSEEEARKILFDAGLKSFQKLAGYIPSITSEKIPAVDIALTSSGIVPGGIIDTYQVWSCGSAYCVDEYQFDNGRVTFQDSHLYF